MSTSVTIHCLAEALSPITHMAGTAGNEALLMREPVVTPQGTRLVPYLSGNALRNRCVREPGARWLVHHLGLAGKLTAAQANFLFHGGALTQGGGREDTALIAEIQRLWPLVRVLGGSLPAQLLAGNLQVWRGTLVCEENRRFLESCLPPRWQWPRELLRPAEHFVSGYQYVRQDARRTQNYLAEGENVESAQMIFAGQAVLKGACFLHGFHLTDATDVEIGALLHSLEIWSTAAVIGGQSARGHGRLKISLLGTDVDVDRFVDAYLTHVIDHADQAVAILDQAFARKGAPEAKGKGKKTKSKASAGEDA